MTRPRKMSEGEQALAVQLEQAGIRFYAEVTAFALFLSDRRWRYDFLVLDHPGRHMTTRCGVIIVEIEGGIYSQTPGRHTRGKGFENDMEKYNAAVLAGYRLLRFSTDQAKDGTAFETIKEALK